MFRLVSCQSKRGPLALLLPMLAHRAADARRLASCVFKDRRFYPGERVAQLHLVDGLHRQERNGGAGHPDSSEATAGKGRVILSLEKKSRLVEAQRRPERKQRREIRQYRSFSNAAGISAQQGRRREGRAALRAAKKERKKAETRNPASFGVAAAFAGFRVAVF